jgi:VanZ family protein
LLAAIVWSAVIVVFGVAPTHEAMNAVGVRRETAITMIGHFIEYAVLASLLAVAFSPGGDLPRPRLVAAFALAAALGLAIELVQIPLPYRECQASDVVVNALGAACGVGVARLVSLLRAPRSRWRCG